MKKAIIIFGAAAMALATTGCQNEPIEAPVVPAEPTELALYASLPATRTTLNEDFSLEWNLNDQLAVFNAPTGTTNYSSNLHFFIDAEAEGKFTAGEDVVVPFEDGVNYDWFVCAPYRATNGEAELKSPKGASRDDGYFPIGAATQEGNNSSVHISGSDIMVGKAENTRTPNVTLKHLAVLHKFTVTNSSNAPTTITKISVNGGDNKLFGTFWVDLTSDTPALDVNKANATFNERALTVTNGTDIAVGESADFYMITAPFTLNSGETMKITLTTSTGTQTIEKTATSDIKFKAGTYNTANLVYDYVKEDEGPAPIFLETFGTSTPYDKANIITYNNDVSGITTQWSNGTGVDAGGYPTGGAIEGIAMRWSGAKANSNTKWMGVSVNGNSTLSVSYDLALSGDAGTTIAFKHRNTGSTKWIEANKTVISAEEKGTIKHISFEIPIADPSKTIEFYISSTTATTYAWVDNIKLDVPAEE